MNNQKSNIFVRILKKIFLSSQGLPIFLTLTFLAILFIIFRMNNVELDYKIGEVNKEISKAVVENKDLKAKKAQGLSAKNLRELAQKHKLAQPKQEQIIVIPPKEKHE